MEPLVAATVAVGSVFATKVVEKTGEKVADVIWDKGEKFIRSLQPVAPETVKKLEQAPEQPLDYGEAVLEVNAIAQEYPTINQAMQELAESAKAETTTPEFIKALNQKIDEIQVALKSQQSSKVEIETQVTGGFYQPNWTVNTVNQAQRDVVTGRQEDE